MGRMGTASNTYQGVRLGFLEVVASIERVVPAVEEKLGPLAVSDNEAFCRHAFEILGDHDINILRLEVRIRLDDAIRKGDRLVANHQVLKLVRSHDIFMDRNARVHDEGVLGEEPDVLAVGKLIQGMPHGNNLCPGHWRPKEIVVSNMREKSFVAYIEQKLVRHTDSLVERKSILSTYHVVSHSFSDSP